MIDLSEPTLRKYRQKVYDIYKQLERDPWSNIKSFEHKTRCISILNAKIKSIRKEIRSSTIQNEE